MEDLCIFVEIPGDLQVRQVSLERKILKYVFGFSINKKLKWDKILVMCKSFIKGPIISMMKLPFERSTILKN